MAIQNRGRIGGRSGNIEQDRRHRPHEGPAADECAEQQHDRGPGGTRRDDQQVHARRRTVLPAALHSSSRRKSGSGCPITTNDNGTTGSGRSRSARKPATRTAQPEAINELVGRRVKKLRQDRAKIVANVPIIMLTARGQEIDRVLGLEMGADDYLIKPFSIR